MDYNMTGYNRLFNNFGYASLNRGIDIPDPDLGIGFAENQRPQTQPDYRVTTKGPFTTPLTTVTQTKFTGQGDPLPAGSFPRSGWMGAAIGEWT